MVKSIFLQDGEEILVDDEDYERVNQHIWGKAFYGNHRAIMNSNSEHLPNFILKKSFQKIKNNDFTRKNLTIHLNIKVFLGVNRKTDGMHAYLLTKKRKV
ncbi:hypothetical protein [Staphylococcus aureus]|uniref:hypothetical protein n=1 Tax=Staphylococcus aureus TaxID=1280 RepID=UPI001D0D206F|nr:hypothetical protein [Staphylococcus aureus]